MASDWRHAANSNSEEKKVILLIDILNLILS